MTAEDWRPIPEANGYEVSSLGRVRNRKTGRILKPNRNGQVTLRDAGQTLGRSINVVQTRAFAY